MLLRALEPENSTHVGAALCPEPYYVDPFPLGRFPTVGLTDILSADWTDLLTGLTY